MIGALIFAGSGVLALASVCFAPPLLPFAMALGLLGLAFLAQEYFRG